MSVTVEGTSQPHDADDAGAAAGEAREEAAEATQTIAEDARQRISPKRVGAGAAALVGFGAGALAIGMVAARRGSELNLRPGEQISVTARPRKGFWRYVATCGLWELERRATQFTLTDQRLITERGLLHRVVNAVQLRDVDRVIVRTGPFEGSVVVATSGPGGAQRSEIGPLAVSSARRLARVLSRGGAEVEEHIE